MDDESPRLPSSLFYLSDIGGGRDEILNVRKKAKATRTAVDAD